MHNKLNVSMTRGLQFGAVVTLAVACSATTDQNPGGSAGAPPVASAGSASGGRSSGGAPSAAAGMPTIPATGGGGASSAMGGGGSGSAPTQAGAGAPSIAGAPSGGTTSVAGSGSGGSAGRAGGSSTAGGSSSAGSNGTAGGSSGSCPGGAKATPCPPTEPNSVAYIGCSMADNIGQGYGQVSGKIMWNNSGYGTGAKVVENWGPSGDAWSLFTTKLAAIGGKDKVKAIMVQICVLSTHSEANVKAMIKAARGHVNPGTHIYITGQPGYEAGHSCFLAGDGGAEWTDTTAKKMAADSSVNQDMSYLGLFKLDSSKGESSDGCHASASGLTVLGNQAKAFWGG